MLEITQQQMAAFEQGSERRFRERVVALIREEFPEHAADASAVAVLVDVAVEDARELGLGSERGLAAYALAAFLLGLDIKLDPYLVAAMRESGDSEAAKVEWIEGYAVAVAEALEG